jgi:hypothetical protein
VGGNHPLPAMDEQDKHNTDSVAAETMDTYPAPPAEVTVEKEAEAEAAPPPTEVTEVKIEV